MSDGYCQHCGSPITWDWDEVLPAMPVVTVRGSCPDCDSVYQRKYDFEGIEEL